jgi:uncharacterized Tic20 family protein/uncharacterized protein YuzE
MQKQGKILRDGQNGNGLVSSRGEKYEFDLAVHWKSDTPPQLGSDVYVELDESGKVVAVESIESVKQAKLARRKQGTILRDGQNGNGLISSQGKKYEFDLIEHWKNDTPPRVGMNIFFELDEAGNLLFVNVSGAGGRQNSAPSASPSAVPSGPKNMAVIVHLLGIIFGLIGTFIIGISSVARGAPSITFAVLGIIIIGLIGAIIIWLPSMTWGEPGKPFIIENAKEVLNFQVSMFLWFIVASFATYIFIGYLLFPILMIFDFISSVRGAMSASNSKVYRYPLSLRLFR